MFGGYDRITPPITKNLLIINALFFIATFVFQEVNICDLTIELGAFYPGSNNFKPWQIITHMFMHGGFGHIFFNMFGLWMFGSTVEKTIGAKNYLLLYFFAGLGSFLLYNLYHYYDAESLIHVLNLNSNDVKELQNLPPYVHFESNELLSVLSQIYTIPMVGASGALYGLLVAFGVLYPNAELMLLFFPVPVKAKYFIPGLIILALIQQKANIEGDNIAHLAHLGGALFGFIFIRKWKQNRFRVN
ncbi:MAG: rhomboid family intramembrane serine protease [Flavobacteriales bacterium]